MEALKRELLREIAGLREDRERALADEDGLSASLAGGALRAIKEAACRAGESEIEEVAGEALAPPTRHVAAIREGWR